MSTLDTIKTDAALAAKYGLPALEAISIALAVLGTGGEATMVIASAEAVLKALQAGVANGIAPADLSNELAFLRADYTANDTAADNAVDAKFGKSPT